MSVGVQDVLCNDAQVPYLSLRQKEVFACNSAGLGTVPADASSLYCSSNLVIKYTRENTYPRAHVHTNATHTHMRIQSYIQRQEHASIIMSMRWDRD